MDCEIRVASCKRGNWRLLDEVFELKPIKRRSKIPFWQFKTFIQTFKTQMSSQITNNNYATIPTSPSLYILRKLNNMKEVQVMKKKWGNWTKLYYKILRGIEIMIDVQKMVKDMKKIAEVANTIVTEMEGSILIASINNQTTNTINILEILENLWYLIQSNIEDQIFRIQRMLANELDRYKGRGNSYVDENIQEIQELYMNEEY